MPDRLTGGNAGRYPRHPGTLRVPRHRRLVRAGAGVLALAVALGTGSCQNGEVGTGPDLEVPPAPGFAAVISNALASTAFLGTTSSTIAGEVAYVSLPPGTLALGESARIINRRSGTVVQTLVINGGFDPVPVVAREGDTLRVEVRWLEGAGGLVASEFSVPPRRPPTIVRTQPPRGKRDIPLNATMMVVFSEPIDPASLTPLAIQLVGGGAPVPGTARIVAGYPWMVEFTPDAPLEPETPHELVVTQAIQDLDGEPLAAEDRIPFTTVLRFKHVAGVYDWTALVMSFDPAWGDLTGGFYSATMTLSQSPPGALGFNGTLEDWRFTSPDYTHGLSTGSLVGIFASNGEVILGVEGWYSWYMRGKVLDSGDIAGVFGVGGHISGTFTARRRPDFKPQ